MKILYSKLIDLPVETKSGDFLGKVTDLEIDIDAYGINKFHIKSSSLIKGLFEGVLIIHQSQIISITSERIVVEDNAKKIKEKKQFNIKLGEATSKPIGVTTSDRK